MGDSKIQIKVGIVEFSGEGDETWLAEQFDKMLAKVPELLKIEVSAPNNTTTHGDINIESKSAEQTELNLSIINIAAKIDDDSGPGLATAAAAYLKLVQQKPTFSRDEILKTMKDAAGFYRDSYSGNLTRILQTLVKSDVLIQNSGQLYSLHRNKERDLHALFNN